MLQYQRDIEQPSALVMQLVHIHSNINGIEADSWSELQMSLYFKSCIWLQARVAVLMALEQSDRMTLLAAMDEGQVADIVCCLRHKARATLLEDLAAFDSSLAACVQEAVW